MPTEKPGEQRDPSPGNGNSERGTIKQRLTSRFKKRPDEHEKKKQLQDYTAWVNNFLKKKPGVPLVTDLRSNLQNGVTFVNLVEIVAKVELDDVERWPNTLAGKQSNIRAVVEFLRSDEVILHPDAARDILEGNAKGIMRVILAMAERYCPTTVKARSSSDPRPMSTQPQERSQPQPISRARSPDRYPKRRSPEGHYMPQSSSPDKQQYPPRAGSPDRLQPVARGRGGFSVSPLAANSFSVPNIAGLQRERSSSLPFHRQQLPPPPPQVYGNALSQPEKPYETIPEINPDGRERGHFSFSQQSQGDENDMYSNPIDQLPPWEPPQVIVGRQKSGGRNRRNSSSSRQVRGIHSIPEEEVVVEQAMEVMQREVGAVVNGMEEFKSELLQLHTLLLQNQGGSETSLFREMPEGESLEPVTPTAKSTNEASTSSAVMEDKNREILELRDQLSQLQDEFTQKEAECATLRNMVEERNSFITTMKSEIYRKEYKNDTERVDLHSQLLQKDTIIKKLEEELLSCKSTLDEHQSEVEDMREQLVHRESQEAEIRFELDSLRAELSRLSSTEESLQSKLSGRDRKITHLEEKIGELQEARTRRGEVLSEEMDGIREGLGVLRSSVPPQDSQQQLIDDLERKISDLMAKMMERVGSPTGRKTRSKHREADDSHHRDREKKSRRHKHLYSEIKPEGIYLTPPTSASGDITKVFYYMLNEKTETPYVTMVPRKSHDVTLRDFKAVFDRHGNFRFFFKTEDPDCGVVKEEIIHDEQVLPSWNGKVLVWVSERERGHHR